MEHNIANECVLYEHVCRDGQRYAVVMNAEVNENEKCVCITVKEVLGENKIIKRKYEDVLIFLDLEAYKKQHQFLLMWQMWCIEKGYCLKVI